MSRIYYYEKKTGRVFNTIFLAKDDDGKPFYAKQAKRLVQVANDAGRLRRLSEKEYFKMMTAVEARRLAAIETVSEDD